MTFDRRLELSAKSNHARAVALVQCRIGLLPKGVSFRNTRRDFAEEPTGATLASREVWSGLMVSLPNPE
jgi:hypothetical protein